ncbi:MAG: YcxB family protein [Acidobacteria bacterium]|nr:MAG: YcxB family protein [Acidobacteriota bacterium]
MQAQFHWSESDYVSAQAAWLRRHPAELLRGFWYPVVIAAFSVAIVAFKPETWLSGLVGIAIALFALGFGVLITRWRWHRHFRQTPLWHDEVTAKVDQHGVSLHSQTYDVHHSWGECSNIYEAAEVIIFEAANQNFVFIPKRDMSFAQLLDLRNTIMTNARVQPRLASAAA